MYLTFKTKLIELSFEIDEAFEFCYGSEHLRFSRIKKHWYFSIGFFRAYFTIFNKERVL